MTLTTTENNQTELSTTAFMQSLREKFKSGQYMEEFYIASALKTVDFDGTFESFQRLDQLLEAFHKQVGILEADFVNDVQKCNTLNLIASHLGEFICKKLGYAENWQNYDEMSRTLSIFKNKPNDFIHQYGINCNGQISLPLFYVVKHFCSKENPLKISQDIEVLITNNELLRINETHKFSEEMHSIQMIYQKGYHLFCGNAFEELVKISNLDYSLDSLNRFDELMKEVRQNHIPNHQQFLADPKNYYFILFLTGYLGRVIAQETGCALRWFTSHQVSQMLRQQIPEQIGTCRIAQIDAGLYFVTQHIADYLFAPTIERTSLEYANAVIQQIKPVTNPIYLAQPQLQTTSSTHSPYEQALQQAGILTSYLLRHIHGVIPRQSAEETVIPTTFPEGTTFYAHPDKDPSSILKSLDENPQNYSLNALGYEMYACLPHIRVDAISLHVRNYGSHHMNIHLVVPFFQTFDYRGFCILQPYFQASDAETDEHIAEIYHAMPAFFTAIENAESTLDDDAKIWKNFYKPKRYPHPEIFQKNIPLLKS